MNNTERMVINAAFSSLVSGNGADLDAAKTVIEFGSKLELKRLFSMEGRSEGKPGHGVTGTTDLGNVTIEDEKKKVREFSIGDNRTRIGHHKASKDREGLISFSHFWASDLESESLTHPTTLYLVGYEPKSLRYKFFAKEGRRKIFGLWLGIYINLMMYPVERLYGEMPREKPRFGIEAANIE